MQSATDYESAWSERSTSESGAIELLVIRTGGGQHETPEELELCPERGVVGDRWSQGEDPDPEAQVTLMNVGVARLVCGEKPLHLPGDNLLVDLDLSEARVPAGTRIALGEGAVVEVSELPHTGCGRFAERLGAEALKWINAKAHRERRLRGVNCRVISGGRVRLGERARVVAPA